jgi:hypothetical protein
MERGFRNGFNKEGRKAEKLKAGKIKTSRLQDYKTTGQRDDEPGRTEIRKANVQRSTSNGGGEAEWIQTGKLKAEKPKANVQHLTFNVE